MKTVKILVLIIFISNISSLCYAQNTGGTDFWFTFGSNYPDYNFYELDLQIRIISGEEPVMGTIYFTNLNKLVEFNMDAQEVFPYSLDNTEKQAVLNIAEGKSNRSIHITSNKKISVYALNQAFASTDATNILPVNALGNDYYQISYTRAAGFDAYAVVAMDEKTQVFQNGSLIATLEIGEVYYRTNITDMTGSHITSDKPVAFFAVNQGTLIPSGTYAVDCLFQQLAPVNKWGKTFFVPVSHLAKDRVRIVASQNGTDITQNGGTLVSSLGSQMSFTNLQAGQFIELEINLNDNGCYIETNYPVGVCSFLTGCGYNTYTMSDPAQSWVPAIEQTVIDALVAPFVPDGDTNLTAHNALIISSKDTKDNTMVSVNGGTFQPLSGGIWRDHPSGMSYYNMPMEHNKDKNYHFTNNGGIVVMCYGTGSAESYYYLGFSAMRNLDAAFYANNIHYQDLENNQICENVVNFRAEIDGKGVEIDTIKWFIDGVEETDVQNLFTWNKTFSPGEYEITMWVHFENDDTITLTSILKRKNLFLKLRNIKH